MEKRKLKTTSGVKEEQEYFEEKTETKKKMKNFKEGGKNSKGKRKFTVNK